ncbi:AMP-binding protein [Noviherbaspirillum saxi]|uniref:AMP-dependent synthetase n=1 Tax=Noviherbaspirillum saxi TaxID=2320863 RepID=A0A3A3FZE6_9BURK|nr:AMP-binding protein [Noviherbaspirillum saxi]RJG00049.1 AMP-dependent synthetase [Noviherbaspirillum saxi]
MQTSSFASLAQLVKSRVNSPSESPLLTFVAHDDTGVNLVDHRHYDSLWRRGQMLARALASRGMGPGDRFALLMQNHAEFVDAIIASSILGTVFVPIDPRTRGKKLQYMLDFVECKGIIAGSYCLDQLIEVAPEVPRLEWMWLVHAEGPRMASLPEKADWLDAVLVDEGDELPIAALSPEAPMQMLFTSGTTGDPKAIICSHGRYAAASLGVRMCGIDANDRMYTGLSLTHGNALLFTLSGALYNQIPAVLSRKFTKSRLWSVIREFRCTTLNLLGGMTTAIYSEPKSPEEVDNPLRMVICSGMPKELWDDFAQRFGVRIVEWYGAAEGGLTFNLPGVGPVGSLGKPPPGLAARILDEEDRECEPFQPGEIVFANMDGSPILVDYYRNSEASEKKTRDGLLRMGDIGYRDEDGWLYFMHRKGSELRRNGEFISPGFIEKEVSEHPDVDDVFIYGVPSASGVPGEKDLVAAIVARNPATWDSESLFAFCGKRLERNSVPTYLQLVDEIPKTASEKPLERVLLESFHPDANNVYTRSK